MPGPLGAGIRDSKAGCRQAVFEKGQPIMATICNDPGGRRRILFIDRNGDRKGIYLGKVSKRTAEEIKTRVESINTAAIAGHSIDGDTAEWLGKIGDALHAKLANAGLVTPRQAPAGQETRLAEFIAGYIAGRTDVKPGTATNLNAGKRRLVEFFGSDTLLTAITPGDADAWLIWLKERFAGATAGKTVKWARQFFRAAVRKKIIRENPFADVKAPSMANEARKFFVTRDPAYRVLDACPDAEWRLLFALSRFGGLRCPSEHLALTWPDVDWERDRFRVVSPKTEHLEGQGVRWVPIFPELRPYLEEVFDLAPEGALHVITRYRDPGANLRTQLQRIIRRAGVEPWPKLFHNLRASRETELAAQFPLHVVVSWIGHTERIAQKHYLQVPDDYFALAARSDSAPDSAQTAQNTAQHRERTERARNTETPANTGVFRGFPGISVGHGMTPTGFEPVSRP
jgi:integrase